MADNAVAWNDDGKRVASVCGTDCAKAAGYTDSAGKLFVRNGGSVRNPQQLFPYPQLKRCSYLIHRGGKFCELTVKIAVQLVDGFLVAAFVFNDIIIIKVDGKPVEKIFLRFFWNTDLAHPVISGSNIDVADFRIE